MCDLCNGSHVIHVNYGVGIRFETCPICGQVSQDKQNEELLEIMQELERKIAKRTMKGA